MTSGGGLPLDEWNKSTPPGWKPGIDGYPLKLYREKLKLWYRGYDGDDQSVGCVVAGRLKEGAMNLALKLRVPKRVDEGGGFVIGDEALCRLEVVEGIDGNGQHQPRIASGLQCLLEALQSTYGLDDEDFQTLSLEGLFDFRSLCRGPCQRA